MSNKIYRSALGKAVDMGSLLAKNETVRAVGNMGVNAKGDTLTPTNKIDETKAQQVNQQYRKQIRNQIIDEPIITTVPNTNATPDTEEVIEGLDIPAEITSTDTPVKKTTKSPKKKSGGLASAIAKAREVEQKKIKSPREESRGNKGVNKI